MSNYKGSLIAKHQLKGKIFMGVVQNYPELEKLTVTPTDEQQTLRPSKYGFEEVVVEPADIEDFTEYKESLKISNKILNKEEM